jgi:hypothetical protein
MTTYSVLQFLTVREAGDIGMCVSSLYGNMIQFSSQDIACAIKSALRNHAQARERTISNNIFFLNPRT